jgi:hypothetical protein
MVAGATYTPRTYPHIVQTSPIAITHAERESYGRTLRTESAGGTVTSTCGKLKCVTAFTVWIWFWIIMLIITPSLFNDSTRRGGRSGGELALFIISIVFLVYALVAYLILIGCVSYCTVDSGRMPCGCITFLYAPLHRLLKAVPSDLTQLYTRVNQLDSARPALWIRVEGYLKDSEMAIVEQNHHRTANKEHARGYHEPRYGFTHYLPVSISSAANVSCPSHLLDEWYQNHGNYAALSFKYTYRLSHEDQTWIARAQQELQRLYTGHENCRYVLTDVVYTLDGFTPTGTTPSSPYDQYGLYDRFRRPGVNAELFNWSQAATTHKAGKGADIMFIRTSSSGLKDTFFNSFCTFISIFTVTYLPYVCCFRTCIVKEADFTHTKELTLDRQLAQY